MGLGKGAEGGPEGDQRGTGGGPEGDSEVGGEEGHGGREKVEKAEGRKRGREGGLRKGVRNSPSLWSPLQSGLPHQASHPR